MGHLKVGQNIVMTSSPNFSTLTMPDGTYRHSLTVWGVLYTPPESIMVAYMDRDRLADSKDVRTTISVWEDDSPDGFAVEAAVDSPHMLPSVHDMACLEGGLAEALALGAWHVSH